MYSEHSETSKMKLFLKNSWLYLTVGFFPKHFKLVLSQGICLDKTKHNPGFRSSCPEVFCKKGVIRKFAKFTGKHLCQKPATLLKKRLWHWCFPVNFTEFLRTRFYIEHLWWLLLFDSYLMFIAKGKLYFSLIGSFYCCLVKRGWSLKVA